MFAVDFSTAQSESVTLGPAARAILPRNEQKYATSQIEIIQCPLHIDKRKPE